MVDFFEWVARLAIFASIMGAFHAAFDFRKFLDSQYGPRTRQGRFPLSDNAEQEARSRMLVPNPTHVALDAPDVIRCTAELTEAEVACARSAGYVDELERCLP